MRATRRILIIVACALASQAWAAQEPSARCKYVLDGAVRAHADREKEISEREANLAKRAQEASSCLARAGDGLARAAIPPSLGSVVGVLNDPGGYISGAMTNAACNVIQTGANVAARGYTTLHGASMRAGQDAQRAFEGEVDQALGGGGISRRPYSSPDAAQKKEEDRKFFQTMSCRVFGRC